MSAENVAKANDSMILDQLDGHWQKVALFLLYKLQGTERVKLTAADMDRCTDAFSPGLPYLLVHGNPDAIELQVVDAATARKWADYEAGRRGAA